MRRALKIIAIILALVVVASGALYLTFPNEIRAIITALTLSEEEILQRQEQSKQDLQNSFAELGIDLQALEDEVADEYTPPWEIDEQTGEVTWQIDPETGKIPMPVNPRTGKVTLPVNPKTGEVVMPVDAKTGESLLPVNPETGETLLPTDENTGDILIPIDPETGESEQVVNPETGEILPEPEQKPTEESEADALRAEGIAKEEDIMRRFFALRDSFIGQLESLPGSASAEFQSLPQDKKTKTNRIKIIRKYVNSAGALEQQCDGAVAALLREMRSVERRYGLPSKADEVEKTYVSMKSSQKAAYMKEYGKYIE